MENLDNHLLVFIFYGLSLVFLGVLVFIQRQRNVRLADTLLRQQQERVEANAALQAANEALKSSHDKLRETQEQLVQSEKMSAVGTLVSGVAHEFNNVLSGLKGYTQLARASSDIAQIQQDLETIEEATDRTIEITRNLLSWVRTEKQQQDFIDVNQVVTSAVALVKTTFSRRNIKINTRLGPLPGMPMAKAEVQDIVMNLIINASHAIDVATEGIIRVSSGIEDDRVVITVSDNGSGIAPENLGKIFLPFFTTKGAQGSSEIPGTGLGLYVVYTVIKNYGGDILVDSVVGVGTTFRIVLPIPEPMWESISSSGATTLEAEALALLSQLNVLVVEDEQILRDAQVRFLNGKAAQVTSAANGREATAVVRQGECDLVFLDLLMPGLNGLETMRRLKAINPGLPVVLMTGQLERRIRDQVILRGAADLISKPFDLQELAGVVRKVARARLRRSIA